MGFTKPDFTFVEKSLGIAEKEFIQIFTDRLTELNLEFLAKDVEPFLFTPEQKNRVLFFRETWDQEMDRISSKMK